jgi:DNA processing protein
LIIAIGKSVFMFNRASKISALSKDDRVNWLRLIRTNNVGSKTFWDLIKFYGSAQAAIDILPSLASKAGGKVVAPSVKEIDAEIEATYSFGAEVIYAFDDDYPKLLAAVDAPPPILSIKGRRELLTKNFYVAIVGARNASLNGCMFAKKIAEELNKKEVVVVSGLAKGVDASAHQGALQYGTIAVIAGGVDSIYPSENSKLYSQMYEKGLVVTEFPFATSPLSKHFPRRNRIISGLSQCVVVVEAALKSGTLITTKFALEQGREVFAVPGSPLDPRCQGTNSLIKQGANLMEGVDDILRFINENNFQLSEPGESNYKVAKVNISEAEIDKWRQKIVEKLSYTPTDIEMLCKELGIPTPIISRVIIELELAGKAQRLYGNKIALVICS